MTLQEIIQAVAEGKTVHWRNNIYTVVATGADVLDHYIVCNSNGYTTGLTSLDGVMQEPEEDFYIGE